MDDPLPQSPYKTLNVPKDATLATIRSAHRKLVLSCHPDKVQDESAKKQKAEQFHQVQQAYEILSDEIRRQHYDEKVKLAELKAEMAEERGPFPSRRAYEYPSPRTGSTSNVEVRGNTIYETRAPASSRYDEPDGFPATYEARPPMSRKHAEDRYDTYYSRKTSGSGRTQDERKKSRAYEEEEDDRRRRERREREAERAAEAIQREQREQRTRRRDKDRRREVESKSKAKFASVEDDGSESEVESRYYGKSKRDSSPKRRSGDEGRRRSGDERRRSGDERRKDRDEPRRSSKRERKEVYDEELEWKESLARDHINRSRDAVETQPRRPEGRSRAASNLDARTPPPLVEKRASGRRSDSRALSPVGRSAKGRRSPEIVESRRPGMPGHSSETLKNKGYSDPVSSSRREAQRSATYQHSSQVKQPSMRRSETLPIDRMRPGNPVPLKSSNLKNMKAPSESSDSSSESDSEMTEDNPPTQRPTPLQRRTTTFGISQEGAYVMEPETYQAHPKESRRPSERPSMGSRGGSTRPPPVARAMSSVYQPDDRRPGLVRHESARVTPLKGRDSGRSGELFGEYLPRSPTEDTFKRSSKTSGDEERHARAYGQKHYSRREPENDAYPGSHRPRMVRSESQQVRAS